jgi:glycosyltransferase involved in cell wall biosynthesis
MGRFILDCELMKTHDSGLFYYCLNLGNAMNEILKAEGKKPVKFYVPPREAHFFREASDVITERPFHKFFKPFLLDCKVWHKPFQSGRLVPGDKKGIKLLITVHDLNVLHQDLPQKEKEESLNSTRQLIQRSSAIVCVSEFTRNDVLRHCDVGQRPVHVIHNGVNHLGEPFLSPSSYRPAKPFLFTIGFVNRKKNHHSLLPLLKFNPDIELVIAGRLDDPDYVKSLQAEAEQNGIADRLHILGPISEAEKSWYHQNCLAYMQPSFAEGFGLPVVEAMQFGKPLFLSQLTSLPEIGGDVAFYFRGFEPDYMQSVFQEGMKQYNLGGLSNVIKERGNNFSWRKSAEKYLEIYHTLASWKEEKHLI